MRSKYLVAGSVIGLTWSSVFIIYAIFPSTFNSIYTFTNIEVTKNSALAIQNKTSEIIRRENSTVARLIWMLWDKGWDRAPPLQAMCLRSFKRYNSDYTIRALNLEEAEKLIDRSRYYSNSAWQTASIQAKSDIIRVELLSVYGGIWADATVYCNEPFSNWIPELHVGEGGSDMFAYERKDKSVNPSNSPWISSWLLVAANHSEMIRIWRDEVRLAWSKPISPAKRLGYFWIHRIFANLTKTNPVIQLGFKNMKFLDAAGPHCLIDYKKNMPHVFKLKARGCLNIKTELFALNFRLSYN